MLLLGTRAAWSDVKGQDSTVELYPQPHPTALYQERLASRMLVRIIQQSSAH